MATILQPAVRPVPLGGAAAAIVAAGIGVFVLGLGTTLASANEAVKSALDWWAPGGPLTGKAGAAVIAWLVSWAALHWAVGRREVRLGPAILWASLLMLGGFILTFPPVFEAVAPEH